MARPAIEALAEQQKIIDLQQRQITSLRSTIASQQQALRQQGGSLRRISAALQAVAEHLGQDATTKITAAMTRHADVQNPAQPVPEPPSEPSPHGTQEAKTPEAFADVTAPGLVPGSTQDVAADVTSTVYTPGQDVPAPAVKQLVDVTRPVDGTQGPLPLGDVKTLTDVRVGDPMNPQTAFPLRGGFANGQRTSAKGDEGSRTMAALRLAKLHIEAGIAEGASDIAEAGRIEADASLTLDAINARIATLTQVKTAAQGRVAARGANLVPRSAAGGVRSVPSLRNTASAAPAPTGISGMVESTVEDMLFD